MDVIVFDGDFQAVEDCSIEAKSMDKKVRPTAEVETTKDVHSKDRYDYVHIYIDVGVYSLEDVIVKSVDRNIGEPWKTVRMDAREVSVRKNMVRKT